LVPKNHFQWGPNMAPWIFHIYSHDQPLHRVNFGVSSYFRFSFFNVDFDLLLLYHMQGSKAFSIHHVKMSLLTNKKYIPTFSLQRLVQLLLHIPYQHNCYLSPTKVVHKYNKVFRSFFQFWTKERIAKTMKLLEEIILAFPMKTNNFYESFNKTPIEP
jgi:hypothetical protein